MFDSQRNPTTDDLDGVNGPSFNQARTAHHRVVRDIGIKELKQLEANVSSILTHANLYRKYSIEPLLMGLSREKYVVKRDDGVRFILRLSPLGQKEQEFQSEVNVHDFLLDQLKGYDIPRVLASGMLPSGEQRYMLLSHLSGINGALLIEQSGDPDLRYAIFKQVGKVLRAIHDLPTPSIPALRKTISTEQKVPFSDSLTQRVLTLDPVDLEIRVRIGELLCRNSHALSRVFSNEVLLHRDLKPQNVLFQLDGSGFSSVAISGVLDFETAHLGNPFLDIASVGLYSDEWEAFLEAPVTRVEVERSPPSCLWDERKAYAIMTGYLRHRSVKREDWRALQLLSLIDQAEIVERLSQANDRSEELIHRRKLLLNRMLIELEK